MLIMEECDVAILFRAVDMAEVTLVFWCYSIAFCYFDMAVTALFSCIQRVTMGECLASHYDGLFRRGVAGRASGESLVVIDALEMAEITDIKRYLHMLPLNHVRMAAPAMKLNSAFHLAEVRRVVKGDPTFGDDRL